MRVLGKLPSGGQHRAGLDQLPAGLSGPERGVYATLGLGLTILAGTRPRLAHLAPAPAAPQVLREMQEAVGHPPRCWMLLWCASPTPSASLFPGPTPPTQQFTLKSAAASAGVNTWADDKSIYSHRELWTALP